MQYMRTYIAPYYLCRKLLLLLNSSHMYVKLSFSCCPLVYSDRCLKRKTSPKQMGRFYRALLVRNLMIMLLTDWGYDVAVFDPDAFILQDPMEMYQKIVQETHAHVIGQRGNMPAELRNQWGFTLCAGAMYYRSSTLLCKLHSINVFALVH